MRRQIWAGMIAVLAVCSTARGQSEAVYSDMIDAVDSRDVLFQGEYVGEIRTEDGREVVGVQVRALGDAEFEMAAYERGLPGEGWDQSTDVIRVKGEREEWNIRFDHPEKPYYAVAMPGYVSVYAEGGDRIGVLEQTVRKSPTLGKTPPDDAQVLFDGSSLDAWKEGAEMTEDGLLKQGATTKEEFGDVHLHLEYRCPYMPGHRGQGRGNSGVYIQRRYEVQVLDSFALPLMSNGNAALYNKRAPKINMSLPPLAWQTYDIRFQAPRFDENGDKISDARLTVKHNGVVVHDGVRLPQGTGSGGSRPEVAFAPLHLQNHGGDPVRYRNVWVVTE